MTVVGERDGADAGEKVRGSSAVEILRELEGGRFRTRSVLILIFVLSYIFWVSGALHEFCNSLRQAWFVGEIFGSVNCWHCVPQNLGAQGDDNRRQRLTPCGICVSSWA